MSGPRLSASRQDLLRYVGVRWVSFAAFGEHRLPPYPCCYVVYSADGALLYVGQTLNLRDRFSAHKTAGSFSPDARLKVRFGTRYGDWAMREARLIYRLRPPMNRKAA